MGSLGKAAAAYRHSKAAPAAQYAEAAAAHQTVAQTAETISGADIGPLAFKPEAVASCCALHAQAYRRARPHGRPQDHVQEQIGASHNQRCRVELSGARFDLDVFGSAALRDQALAEGDAGRRPRGRHVHGGPAVSVEPCGVGRRRGRAPLLPLRRRAERIEVAARCGGAEGGASSSGS
jgi:hypothetical protein